jgi:ATP-dependent Clp protease ATP-binding subunit ClpA
MFERFTDQARQVVITAQVQARTLRHDWIGTEHLLLAILAQPTTLSARALHGHGLTLERASRLVQEALSDGSRQLDAEALRAIGIDLDSVRASVEASFGEGALDPASVEARFGGAGQEPAGRRARRGGLFGHVRFSARAKKALELGLREAIRLRQNRIGDAHLLLGLLREGQGLAALVLTRAGIDLAELRDELERELRQAG